MTKARKRTRKPDPQVSEHHEPSAGILPPRIVKSADTPAGMRQIVEQAATAASREQQWYASGEWLDDIDKAIAEVLAPLHAHNTAMQELPAKKAQGTVTPADKQHAADLRRARENTPAHELKRQHFAREAAAYLQQLRQAIEANDTAGAAQYAYRLGRTLEHVRIALFEPPADLLFM